MKKVGMIVLFFVFFISSSAVFSRAQDDERWFVAYNIFDLSSRQLVLDRDFETSKDVQNTPILAGGEYNLTIILDVGLTAAYANLTLSVNLGHAVTIDRYWEVYLDYLGVSEKFGREYLKLYLQNHFKEIPLQEVGDSLRRIG